MPSAASLKVEKPPTTNISANNAVAANIKDAVPQGENVDNSSPVRQVALIIEHKIRNLEKRKVSKSKKHKKKMNLNNREWKRDKKFYILSTNSSK